MPRANHPNLAAGSCSNGVYAGGRSNAKTLALRSDFGEIVVTLQQASGLNGSSAYNETMYSPPDKLSGVRMADADAKRLMKTYARSMKAYARSI